jgi:hypothetical protein
VRGSFVHVPLGQTQGTDAVVLDGALPEEARGGRLVALSLSRSLAAEAHGDFARVDGILTLGLPRAVTPTGEEPLLSSWQDWQGRDNVEAESAGAEARIRFLLSNEAAAPRFQPRQPTDAGPVPVLVSPGVAAAAGGDGSIPLRLPGGLLRGRVVAVAERFPSTSGDFVVADESTAFVAANAARPGALVADEVWLDAGSPQRADALRSALARPPFDRLAVESRAALERRLRDDPLARGSLFTVGAAAAGAAVLAFVGLLLLVAADARDERRELRDLEAEGMGPRALRRHVRLRAGLVAVLGLVGGFVLAAVLAPLVVDLVSVTAAAATAEPPLVVRIGWPLLLAGLAAAAALAAALVLAATRRTPS